MVTSDPYLFLAIENEIQIFASQSFDLSDPYWSENAKQRRFDVLDSSSELTAKIRKSKVQQQKGS